MLSPRLVPLVGTPKEDASKNREGDGSLALGGRRLVLSRNNQPIVGRSNRRDDGVVGRLDMYCTKVLMYRTMVLMARLTKVRR